MDKMCEKSIYEMWYDQIVQGNTSSMKVDVKTQRDILELQNYFLVCQRLRQEYGLEKKLDLDITCALKDEYRIKHYLYLAIHYENVGTVRVNSKVFIATQEVNFYKIFPLILVDRDMYEFLSMKVSKIAELYSSNRFIDESLYLELIGGKGEPDRKQLLTRVCIYNLIGEVEKNAGEFSVYRKKYFQTLEFNEKIENIPFLALLIFSIYIRAKNIDAIQYRKEKERKDRKIRNVRITSRMAEEIFPSDEEIDADIFNSWDISDGLLQLVENIVFHAGRESKNRGNGQWGEKAANGEGTLLLRLHKNDTSGEKAEFNEDSELFRRYSQYFRGYRKEYNDGKGEENEALSLAAQNLKRELSQGYFVEKSAIEAYEDVRGKIEERRWLRQKSKYFLEIQVSDYSGKYMCDVFRNNLIKRNDPHKNSFNYMCVRSFFDPAQERLTSGNPKKTINEKTIWKNYYEGDNGIQHYGLQIFLSIITSNEGSFDVKSFSENNRITDYYSNTGAKDSFDGMLPGTRYSILLPMTAFSAAEESLNTFVNTDINYSFQKLKKFEPCESDNDIILEFYKKLHEESKVSNDKAVSAERLRKLLNRLSCGTNILLFDCKEMSDSMEFEIFCKTLILLVAKKEKAAQSKEVNIAIINCETNHFVSFIRFFSIYYDKNGNCDWMDKKQIYLCGENSMEEFLISGRNIQEMIGRVEKLAFTRRLNPRCLRLLSKMLERRVIGGDKLKRYDNVPFLCTPFDLLIKNKEKKTIFEQNVLKVLESNIQNIESGCKIYPTHMRLGSKIHISTFYEAELLFYNNYYVNRFAYLLAEKLLSEQLIGVDKDNMRPIWLVGYETYSEMLICRLRYYLCESFKGPLFYSIYETARGVSSNQEENFRYCDDQFVAEMIEMNAQIFFVVPINSTLTTFSKLRAALANRISDVRQLQKMSISISGYLGIIQVLDAGRRDKNTGLTDMEKQYWSHIDEKNLWIQSEKLFGSLDVKVHYIISIKSVWRDPNKCDQCYPKDCLFESPLIETDRTSVVPTQLIGLKEESETFLDRHYESYGKIESLINHFYYDHVERGNNHYQIYVRTANYFKDNAVDIRNWLREKVAPKIRDQKKAGCISFDVLVNPLHFSNAAFVEAVDEEVFNGASYTLRIDVEKEFRDNVESKFSDLKILYSKLKGMNIQAEINFHFVDDSINLGDNINRMRHFVTSLFPMEAMQKETQVKVNIYRNVIVLLNRLSYASIRNYIDDTHNYFYYLDLRISSMRTHEDACFLCKEVSNAEKLGKLSATNGLVLFWNDKHKKYMKKSLKEAKDYKKSLDEKNLKYYDKYYKRIFCSHMFNSNMVEMGNEINHPLEVLRLIVRLINDKRNDREYPEYMMSYLYIYAHPFISYRKSCREGAFALVTILLDALVVEESQKGFLRRVQCCTSDRDFCQYIQEAVEIVTPLLDIIEKMRTKDKLKKQYYDLFKLLMKLSAELKGNYITREDRIIEIMAFNQLYAKDDESKNTFHLYYLSLIKRVLSLNLDESKSTHFEQVLVRHGEDLVERCEKLGVNKKDVKEFLTTAYVENTPVIYGAIKSLRNCKIIESKTLDAYYYENYKKIMKINQINDIVLFTKNLLKLNHLLEKTIREQNLKSNGSIDFYEKISEQIRIVLNAEVVKLAVKSEERILKLSKNHKVVYSKEDTYKIFAESGLRDKIMNNADEVMRNVKKKKLLLDTFLIQDNIVIVKYPILLGKDQQEGNSSGNEKQVFIIVEFKEQSEKNILQRLRYLLLFREKISQRLTEDFDNNIIQEWLEKNNVMTQMRRARSSFHTDNENPFDYSKVWPLSEGFLFGDDERVKEHTKKYHDKQLGCILGLMMNIRIGRANVLLLSGGKFITEAIERPKKFGFIREDINALRNIYFYDKINICDRDGIPISNNEIFTEATYERIMAKGKDGDYYSFHEYLIYFIFELFHSAFVHGPNEQDNRVLVKVYDEGEYLYMENKTTANFKIENVKSGLRREETGISLATICEFFIYNYENRFVHLMAESDRFIIGIPIFEK